MARKKGSKEYPVWMKREAIIGYLENGLSYQDLTARFQIRDPKRVMRWVNQYRREGESMFEKKKPLGRKPLKKNKDKYIARLEMEVEVLKKAQSELQKDMLVKRNIGRSSISKGNIQ